MPGENDSTTSALGALVGSENMTVTTSPTLNPTVSGGGLDAFANSTPGQHSTDPATLFAGGLQRMHCPIRTAPSSLLKVPAGQG